DHGHRGWHRTCRADALLALAPDRQALAGRESVGHDRRLERHECLAGGDRCRDLRRDHEHVRHGIAPGFATQRAAASRPSSTPPTRKPAAKASPAPVVSTASTGLAACSSLSPPADTTTPAGPRLTTSVAARGSPPSAASSRSPAKTTSG